MTTSATSVATRRPPDSTLDRLAARRAMLARTRGNGASDQPADRRPWTSGPVQMVTCVITRGLLALGLAALEEHGDGVFAAHEVTIDAPYDVVSGRLTHLLNHAALHAVSEAAYEGGWKLTLRVGPFGAVRGLSRLVRVRTLEPVRRGDRMTVGLRWEATGGTGELFPVLDAELILSAGEADRSRLELLGSYRPPWGRAGVVLNRVIMGRIADATIRSLLEETAIVLGAPEREWHTEPGAPHVLPVADLDEA